MPIERLDLRTVRYDQFSGSVQIDARKSVVEISLEALELLNNRSLTPEEAVVKAVAEAKLFTRLASRLPADDGKIHITARIVENDGLYADENGS
ncbi:MAG: hypothetical protein AAF362_16410 [Pseudomonadota bacterium]